MGLLAVSEREQNILTKTSYSSCMLLTATVECALRNNSVALTL